MRQSLTMHFTGYGLTEETRRALETAPLRMALRRLLEERAAGRNSVVNTAFSTSVCFELLDTGLAEWARLRSRGKGRLSLTAAGIAAAEAARDGVPV